MVDQPMTEESARKRFAVDLIEVDARGPAPNCEEQSAALFAEHETECNRLEREQSDTEKRTRRG